MMLRIRRLGADGGGAAGPPRGDWGTPTPPVAPDGPPTPPPAAGGPEGPEPPAAPEVAAAVPRGPTGLGGGTPARPGTWPCIP